eukprot:551486_1
MQHNCHHRRDRGYYHRGNNRWNKNELEYDGYDNEVYHYGRNGYKSGGRGKVHYSKRGNDRHRHRDRDSDRDMSRERERESDRKRERERERDNKYWNKPVTQWNSNDIYEWIIAIDNTFKRYKNLKHLLNEQEIIGNDLKNVTEENIKKDFEIKSFGDKKLLFSKIQEIIGNNNGNNNRNNNGNTNRNNNGNNNRNNNGNTNRNNNGNNN